MDFIFLVVSRLVQAPLIDCGCLHTFLYPSQAGCATNTRKRAAPNPCKKDMLRSSRTMWRSSVGCASLSQDGLPRVRNGAQTNGAQRLRRLRSAAHARPIRLVNEIANGKIGLDLASVISATRVSVHLPTRFSINH